jgi:tRNA pseudouridine55 synthase
MKQEYSGFILINKPSGPTSHDIIDKLRKITGIRKIGHAGTLDPLASGCLIVGIGRQATRQLSKFLKLDKEYIANINLSANTDTYDKEGEITKEFETKKIAKKEMVKTLKGFLGKKRQVPPIFSAKKQGGEKLYKLARRGIKIKPKPSLIEIFKIKIIRYSWPKLQIKVKCSSGTYIRSLAYDIGRKLGCGGYLEKLKRTAQGRYKIKQARALSKINKNNWHKLMF